MFFIYIHKNYSFLKAKNMISNQACQNLKKFLKYKSYDVKIFTTLKIEILFFKQERIIIILHILDKKFILLKKRFFIKQLTI